MRLPSLQKKNGAPVMPLHRHCYSAVRDTLPATFGPCRSIAEQTKSQIKPLIGKHFVPPELSTAINLGLLHKTTGQPEGVSLETMTSS